MSTKTERIAQLQNEIADITSALSAIRKAGQSYSIMSSSGGGSQRTTTLAPYQELIAHRKELQSELDGLQGTRGFRVRAGW